MTFPSFQLLALPHRSFQIVATLYINSCLVIPFGDMKKKGLKG